jgi:hypothetical protein
MNDKKLDKILDAVRAQTPPSAPGNFEQSVLKQIRNEPAPRGYSLADQLSALFPRIAFAAIIIIALCVAGDFLLTVFNVPQVEEGMAQVSDEWLLPEIGI